MVEAQSTSNEKRTKSLCEETMVIFLPMASHKNALTVNKRHDKIINIQNKCSCDDRTFI